MSCLDMSCSACLFVIGLHEMWSALAHKIGYMFVHFDNAAELKFDMLLLTPYDSIANVCCTALQLCKHSTCECSTMHIL